MKASELIERLHALIAAHGDKEVLLEDWSERYNLPEIARSVKFSEPNETFVIDVTQSTNEVDVIAHDPKKAAELIKMLSADVGRLRTTLYGILAADYKSWWEGAGPDDFIRWAKSRVKHALNGGE